MLRGNFVQTEINGASKDAEKTNGFEDALASRETRAEKLLQENLPEDALRTTTKTLRKALRKLARKQNI